MLYHMLFVYSMWLLILIQTYVSTQNVNNNPELKYARDERNPDLSYSFSYETIDGQLREESGTFVEVNGQKVLFVKGKYSYTGDDGEKYQVNYESDQNGYRAEAEHLPMKRLLTRGYKMGKAMVPILGNRINPSLVASLTGG